MSRITLRMAGTLACILVAVGCSSSKSTKDGGVGDGAAGSAGSDGPSTTADMATTVDMAVTPKDGPAGTGDGGTAGDKPAGDAAVLTAEQARGQYLVDHVLACGDCHTPSLPTGAPDMSKYLAGNAAFFKLPNGDALPTRNLTNHETGLKNRTADEIKKMFRDGIRPAATGEEALNPFMPYYVFHNMKDADADAIVAYLRTVPGVMNEIPKRGASFDVPAHATYLDLATIPTPADNYPEKASALRGRYLAAETGVCIECHTPHNAPTMPPSPQVLDPAKFFQGGEDFGALGIPGHPISKNLTSDPTTGLGMWTAADIVKVLKQGKDKMDKGICPPMPVGPFGAFGGLTDGDAMDIANYIKSLPPKVNMVVDTCTWPPMMPPPGDGGATDALMTPIDGAPAADAATNG